MPRKEGQKNLSITMSEDELAFVHEVAKDRGHIVTADYVRELIERDIKAHGKEFNFTVNRGGDRRTKPK